MVKNRFNFPDPTINDWLDHLDRDELIYDQNNVVIVNIGNDLIIVGYRYMIDYYTNLDKMIVFNYQENLAQEIITTPILDISLFCQAENFDPKNMSKIKIRHCDEKLLNNGVEKLLEMKAFL